jgi:hypothetical protein
MTDRKPRVLLLEAEIRTSERTRRQWYSAWFGRCRLVGFESDEPNERGHRTIKFFAEALEPRKGPAATRQRASGRRPASAARRDAHRPSWRLLQGATAGECASGGRDPARLWRRGAERLSVVLNGPGHDR